MRQLLIIGSTLLTLTLTATPAFTDTGDQVAKLLAQDGAAFDSFGISVAISGTTAIVGASKDDDDGDSSGSAYLFDTITGLQLSKLLPLDGAASKEFGKSVAIDGTTAIVSANGSLFSSAYLFDTSTGAQTFKLKPLDATLGNGFGNSVAISGTIAIVGNSSDDDNGSNAGAAYLFDTNTGLQTAKMLPLDAAIFDSFGSSVAISGTTAIIGAPNDDDNGNDSGSAYLFDARTGLQIAKLLPLDGAASGSFGDSVAISGTTAIVGAFQDDDNGTSSGSAYLFDTNTGTQISKLLPLDGAIVDQFGSFVSISGTTALVGAFLDDDNGLDSGSAYLFDTRTGAQIAKLLPLDGMPANLFGSSVSISGTTAVIGASSSDENGLDSGSAYLFDVTNTAVPASTTVRNGSGGNATLFSKVTDPILGLNWDTDVDTSGHASSVAVVAAYRQPLSGIFLSSGELLVDLTSPFVTSAVLPHSGNTVRFSVPIPVDGSLFGVSVSTQAAVLGSPGLELSNALDLLFGF